ncbi:PREDICTED: uncharacterized protein LOC105974248 [Erythranthe guttata]|nr:PREDICTED: uncharacterized protein LOC105974248 [Erythranthe guttata]|eukprot:XP_012854771.1 PREDICTED: uncharacterized protein LOC105974248 [Erythranthe guttata]
MNTVAMQKYMGFSTAAAPPSPAAATLVNTRSFSLTSTTQRNHINFKQKSPLFQLRYTLNNNNNNFHGGSQHTLGSTFTQFTVIAVFSLTLLILRLASDLLLPDFPRRWRRLIGFASQAEAELVEAPEYLFQGVVAYEDRRFFSHSGVDAIGVARAILSLSARGGGSTITQQLVKNTFLKNERTLSRKFIEMALAVALERKISKPKILSAYLCKIYWGHGIYGIKSASNLYFGKHPSLLTLGECALLIGIIPAPESRSPFRDYSRGKTFQARVLKRMVVGHFLDIESALSAVRKPFALKSDGPEYAEKSLFPVLLPSESGYESPMKDTWDWERESKMWEVVEDMEKWAMSFRKIVKTSNL